MSMSCRSCGSQTNEDGDAECYCGYERNPCEVCDEETLDIHLDLISDYKGVEFFCCPHCQELKREENESWMVEFQLSLEGILADYTHDQNWNAVLQHFQSKPQH